MSVPLVFIICAGVQALVSVILSLNSKAPEANTMLLWALLNLNAVVAYHLIKGTMK